MKYRRLGNSGLQISEISLGSWLTLGNMSQKDSEHIIDKAIQLGINMFDTANVYDYGKSEQVLGESLAKYDRHSYIVATKAFWPMSELSNDKGLSKKHLYTQIHNSLKRLDMEYIDIFYCHRFDNECNLYETIRTLDDFIRQGKLLYIGISEWTANQITEGLKIQDQYLLDRFIVTQSKYNLFQRDAEKEIFPTCIKNGMGVIAFSPLAQGFLSGKYRKGRAIPKFSRAASENTYDFIKSYLTPQNFDIIEKFLSFAQEKECTPSQLALAWILHKHGISSALIGTNTLEQLEENIKACEIKFTNQEIEIIENIFV